MYTVTFIDYIHKLFNKLKKKITYKYDRKSTTFKNLLAFLTPSGHWLAIYLQLLCPMQRNVKRENE